MCRVHFLLYFNFAVCVTGGYIVSFWVDNIVADVSKLGLTIVEAACEKDEEEEEEEERERYCVVLESAVLSGVLQRCNARRLADIRHSGAYRRVVGD